MRLKRKQLLLILGGLLVVGMTIAFFPFEKITINAQTPMKISSPMFQPGEMIPGAYTCEGENVNPPLVFENVPKQAQSLVLIMEDPDAPMGTWNHWVLWNLDPKLDGILENSLPDGVNVGVNSSGQLGYEGPCPPSGQHRYFFRLYALSGKLNLRDGATKEEVQNAMKNYILDQADFMGMYQQGS